MNNNLTTPFIIYNNNFKIADLFNDKANFIEVDLTTLDINPYQNNLYGLKTVIDNYIVKSLINKYTDAKQFIDSISCDGEFNPNDLNSYYFHTKYLTEIQEELKYLDIIFINYEKLGNEVRRHINNFVRIHFVVGNGTLLFHIASKKKYMELVHEGYHFDTYCDEEKILMGHEIQEFRDEHFQLYYKNKH